MRLVSATICFLVFSLTALAQNDRGTITGTISDPAGADDFDQPQMICGKAQDMAGQHEARRTVRLDGFRQRCHGAEAMVPRGDP